LLAAEGRLEGEDQPAASDLDLPETVREFLEHRPLDADLDRAEFVRLGVEYVAQVGQEGEGEGGA